MGFRVGTYVAEMSEITLDGLNLLKKSGIDCIELSFETELCDKIDYALLKKNAEISGIELWSFHLPFSPFETNNIASLDEAVRTSTVAMHSEYIKKAAGLGCKVAVIHPSGEPNSPEDRNDKILKAKQSLCELASVAKAYGIILAVEDLPRSCLGNTTAEISELISADKSLRVCFDTNHLLQDKNEDFIKALGEKIATIHVSDYDLVDERHWLPGEGKVDWNSLINGLKKCGYTGPFMYEVGLETPKTILRERDLFYSDYKRNCEELEASKVPTTFCTHKENL